MPEKRYDYTLPTEVRILSKVKKLKFVHYQTYIPVENTFIVFIKHQSSDLGVHTKRPKFFYFKNYFD